AIHRADRDVGGTAPVLVVLDPAPGERLLRDILAVDIGLDADDPGAGMHELVPAAMLRQEYVVAVFSREVVASVELHAERRHVRPDIQRRRRELAALVAHGVFRIRNVTLVAVRGGE